MYNQLSYIEKHSQIIPEKLTHPQISTVWYDFWFILIEDANEASVTVNINK